MCGFSGELGDFIRSRAVTVLSRLICWMHAHLLVWVFFLVLLGSLQKADNCPFPSRTSLQCNSCSFLSCSCFSNSLIWTQAHVASNKIKSKRETEAGLGASKASLQPALAGSFTLRASPVGFGSAVILSQPCVTFMSLESSHYSVSHPLLAAESFFSSILALGALLLF